MNLKKLLEQVKKYEDVLVVRKEEAKRNDERLESLEQARQEAYDLVTSDNANDIAHIQMDQDDNEIADLKKEIKAHLQKTRSILRSMRTRILQTQERAVENLQVDLRRKQETQTHLKNELIPKTETRLANLREKEKKLADQIHQHKKESRKITRMNLDNLALD